MNKLLTLLPGATELAPVPEYFITAVTQAEILGGCAVRLTFASESAGVIVPQCSLIWTVPQWIAARASMQAIMRELETVAPEACLLARQGLRALAH